MYTLRFYAKDPRGQLVERPSRRIEYKSLALAVTAADEALTAYPDLHVVHVVAKGGNALTATNSAKCVVFR